MAIAELGDWRPFSDGFLFQFINLKRRRAAPVNVDGVGTVNGVMGRLCLIDLAAIFTSGEGSIKVWAFIGILLTSFLAFWSLGRLVILNVICFIGFSASFGDEGAFEFLGDTSVMSLEK